MNPTNVIREDWAHEPRVVSACLHVWQALCDENFLLDHYTFDYLQELSKEIDRRIVSRALLYLANPKLRVLKICLMYEFDGGFFELPAEEVEHYHQGKNVIHPEYGDILSSSEIIVCFTQGASLAKGGEL